MPPGTGHTSVIQSGSESVVSGRAVVVVLDVVFPRPDYLDRRVHRFGDFNGIGNEILFRAAPESSAQECGMHPDFIGGQAGELHRGIVGPGLTLGSDPDITFILAHMGGSFLGRPTGAECTQD